MEELKGIKWLGHASFFFADQKTGNKIYYIDPFELHQTNLAKGDIIFITHAHQDHFSPQDIEKIAKPDSVLVAPPDILEKASLFPQEKVSVKPNERYTVKDFSFETVPAYNIHPDKLQFHPQANNWVGYIFDLNGKRVYHAGDTDFIPEMNALKNLHLDVAMIPMGGNYVMDPKEAADAANAIGAKITIPMHYKRLLKEKTEEGENTFKSLVKNSKVVILEELK